MSVIEFSVAAPKMRALRAERKAREDAGDWTRMVMWSAMMPFALGLIWTGTVMMGAMEGVSDALKVSE